MVRMRRVGWLGIVSSAIAITAVANAQTGKGVEMHHAVGTFEVKLKPEPLSEVASKTEIGRMSMDKTYQGQLEGTSQGEFLASGSASGSGSYVAIEKITGSLDGKRGSFVLVHQGTMVKGGSPQLTVSVVPGSGTGELVGISGTLQIVIKDGQHTYVFDYSL